jgi:Xaa-Pro aminopeptidase
MEDRFEILKDRANKLLDNLPENSIVLLESSPEKVRNNDVNYPFRQNSNVLFLTDCNEKDNFWAIERGSGKLRIHMACKPEDKKLEQWVGSWVNPNNAIDLYGVDEVVSVENWPDYLKKLLLKFDCLWLDFSNFSRHNKILDYAKNNKNSISNVEDILKKLRMKKDRLCKYYLQKSINASSIAHVDVMKRCRSFSNEADIDSSFFSSIRLSSGELAYPTIAASGANACVLHYIQNNKKLDKKDFVLLDAGAEYRGYAADITRTFPVSGKFSSQQADLYNIVLSAQEAAISMIKPNITWVDLEKKAREILLDGCLQLNIFNDKALTLNREELIKIVFPHGLGHHLGLDVHDACPKGRFEYALEKDNVITIEPGLYLNNSDYIRSNWLNFGIRIEDDILVTADGFSLLSDAPKDIALIEDVMS